MSKQIWIKSILQRSLRELRSIIPQFYKPADKRIVSPWQCRRWLNKYDSEVPAALKLMLEDTEVSRAQFANIEKELRSAIQASLESDERSAVHSHTRYGTVDFRIGVIAYATALGFGKTGGDYFGRANRKYAMLGLSPLPFNAAILAKQEEKKGYFLNIETIDNETYLRLYSGLELEEGTSSLAQAGISWLSSDHRLWFSVCAAVLRDRALGRPSVYGQPETCQWRFGGNVEHWAMFARKMAAANTGRRSRRWLV